MALMLQLNSNKSHQRAGITRKMSSRKALPFEKSYLVLFTQLWTKQTSSPFSYLFACWDGCRHMRVAHVLCACRDWCWVSSPVILYFLRRSLSLNLLGLAGLSISTAGITEHPTISGSCVGAGDLSSGPCACKPSTLTADPHRQFPSCCSSVTNQLSTN